MKRTAISKHSSLSRIFAGFILAGFVYFITRLKIQPTLFSLVVIVISIGLIGDAVGRFFAGKNDWKILIPAGLVVLADILFFALVPASPI